jgi:hypothetical protein
MEVAKKELAEWLTSTSSSWLTAAEPDGGLVIQVFGEQTQLTVPESYPNSADDYFFFDTEVDDARVRAVVNDAREYIFDQPPSLSLAKLLDKIQNLCERAEGAYFLAVCALEDVLDSFGTV